MRIQVFYVLKTNDIQFKSGNKHAYAGKRICHNIFLTFDVLDNIRKRLNKLNPFGMSLIQFRLTLKIFKRFMIRMDDKFMWAKLVFTLTQNLH